MPDSINIRSVATLAELRAALAKFAAAVAQSLDEVDMELRRAVDWVRLERPGHWKKELQRAWDRVAEARNELAQCEARAYDGQRPSCYQEKKALEAAKAYVRTCQEKIEIVRHWCGAIGQEASEYQGYVGQLRTMLESEVPRSMALLNNMIAAIESYAALQAPTVTRPVGSVAAATANTGSPATATLGFMPGRDAHDDDQDLDMQRHEAEPTIDAHGGASEAPAP